MGDAGGARRGQKVPGGLSVSRVHCGVTVNKQVVYAGDETYQLARRGLRNRFAITPSTWYAVERA